MKRLILAFLTGVFLFAGAAGAEQQCLNPSDTPTVHERLSAAAGGIQLAQNIVCSAGYSACKGACGATCYQPARGQKCFNGAVCAFGQQACGCSCYTPSRGEKCQ